MLYLLDWYLTLLLGLLLGLLPRVLVCSDRNRAPVCSIWRQPHWSRRKIPAVAVCLVLSNCAYQLGMFAINWEDSLEMPLLSWPTVSHHLLCGWRQHWVWSFWGRKGIMLKTKNPNNRSHTCDALCIIINKGCPALKVKSFRNGCSKYWFVQWLEHLQGRWCIGAGVKEWCFQTDG